MSRYLLKHLILLGFMCVVIKIVPAQPKINHEGIYVSSDGTTLSVEKMYNSMEMTEKNCTGFLISYLYGGDNNWIPQNCSASFGLKGTWINLSETFMLESICINRDCKYYGYVLFSVYDKETVMTIIAIDLTTVRKADRHFSNVNHDFSMLISYDYIFSHADIILKLKKIKNK